MLTNTLFMIFIAALTLPIGVASLRCPCFVQTEGIGHNYSLGYVIRVPPTGDSNAFYDALVEQLVQDSLKHGTANKTFEDTRDFWGSFYARDRTWNWPACHSGSCQITRDSATWDIMKKLFQFQSNVRASDNDSQAICMNVSTPLTRAFTFTGCGILPGANVSWNSTSGCFDGIFLNEGQQDDPICVHSFSNASTDGVDTSAANSISSSTSEAVLATNAAIGRSTLPRIAASAELSCPCAANITMEFGQYYLRETSSPVDDAGSLLERLRRSAARANFDCDRSNPICYEARNPADLQLPFWPGCVRGRCAIKRGDKGGLWQKMAEFQFPGDIVPDDAEVACARGVLPNQANGLAKGWRAIIHRREGFRDLVEFEGCLIWSPTSLSVPRYSSFCHRQFGIAESASGLCIQEISQQMADESTSAECEAD